MNEIKIFTDNDIKEFSKDIELMRYHGLKKEKLKQVYYDGKPTIYLISSYGRVFSTKYRSVEDRLVEIKQHKKSNGYMEVCIWTDNSKKYITVHKLVCIHFIKNKDPDNRIQINHLDGNKENNIYFNLEWCTAKENIQHAYDTKLIKPRFGEDVPTHKFTESDIIDVCNMIMKNLSLKEISESTGVIYDMIRAILKKRAWKHIVNNYDFSNYTYGKSNEDIDKKIKSINKACKMFESGDYTMKQISDETGIKVGILFKIKTHQVYRDISSNYKI